MSTRSSSWSGSGAARRASDIIDLDQFMRGGVRPLRPDPALLERLVVDGGGRRAEAGATGREGASGSAVGGARRARRYAKRFSHDSGLSDDSYVTRVSHRRGCGASGRSRERKSARALGSRVSRKSLRDFRAVCERALLDQQQQIARVVELCERLARRKALADERQERTPTGADSSDGSSSSRTTPDCGRKQQRRTDECKTYKIIMSKLDELNRVFGARSRSRAQGAAGAARPAASSSGSVSMSDKVVGTEPPPRGPRRPGHRTDGAVLRCETRTAQARGDCSLRRHSAAAEGSAGESSASACDARCGFDLEDPVHLYSQAKRLQGERAPAPAPSDSGRGRRRPQRDGGSPGSPAPPTLCALCRGYWRTLRQFVVAQLFGAPPGPSGAF